MDPRIGNLESITFFGRRLTRGRTAPISCPPRDLEPIAPESAAGGRNLAEWIGSVDRYHPRGCRSPIGRHLARFIVDGGGRRPGRPVFESARRLPVRDQWIGWADRLREAGLSRVVPDSRFPALPRAGAGNQASRRLSPTARRVAEDRHRRRGVRPLLAEAFVGPRERDGGRHRASGWTRTGTTASGSPKDVCALEPAPDARAAPRGEPKSGAGRKTGKAARVRAPKTARTVAGMWSKIAAARRIHGNLRPPRPRVAGAPHPRKARDRQLSRRSLRPPPGVRVGARLRRGPCRDAGATGDAGSDVEGAGQGRSGGVQGSPPGDP